MKPSLRKELASRSRGAAGRQRTPAQLAAHFRAASFSLKRHGLGLSLGLLAFSSPARAELMHDVAALKQRWRAAAPLEVQAPRLIERGGQHPLSFPERLTRADLSDCTSVVLLSDRKVSFLLRTAVTADSPADAAAPEPSVAGMIQLVRCGKRREELGRMRVEMRSPRGVIEVVAGVAPAPLPSARRLLTAREPGPTPEAANVGPPARLPSLTERFTALKQQAELRGSATLLRHGLISQQKGQGAQDLELYPGCYRVDALGPQAPEGWRGGLDIDLDVRRLPDGALVASDRSEALDAHVEFCTASPGAVRLGYSGGLPGAPLLGLVTRWPFPRLPDHFSDATKNQLALLWHRNRITPLGDEKRLREWLGVAGLTRVSLPTQAGTCYSVFVAPHAGAPEGFALAARSGRDHAENQSTEPGTATFVSFCARKSGQARLSVEAQGGALIWRMVAYRTGQLGRRAAP